MAEGSPAYQPCASSGFNLPAVVPRVSEFRGERGVRLLAVIGIGMCPLAAIGNCPETVNLITQCHCVPELRSFLIRPSRPRCCALMPSR